MCQTLPQLIYRSLVWPCNVVKKKKGKYKIKMHKTRYVQLVYFEDK